MPYRLRLLEGHGPTDAARLALLLYVVHNTAATVVAIPAGRWIDRAPGAGAVRVLAVGTALATAGYLAFSAPATTVLALAPGFLLAGLAIGCVETAENAAVAAQAPDPLRGSAFGVLAAIQSVGNLVASGVAGLLWTVVSPAVAFRALAAFTAAALAGLVWLATSGNVAAMDQGR